MTVPGASKAVFRNENLEYFRLSPTGEQLLYCLKNDRGKQGELQIADATAPESPRLLATSVLIDYGIAW